MSPHSSPPPEQDPRTYFAAERTFLAWLRTGLALMGIGFAVARFGLFLREMQPNVAHIARRSPSASLWSGVALVALGVIVNLGAAARHVRLIRELRSGQWQPGRISTSAILLAIFLAFAGVAVAAYLIASR